MALSDFRRQHGQMTGAFRPMTIVAIRPTQPAKPIAAPQHQKVRHRKRPGIVVSAMGPMIARQQP